MWGVSREITTHSFLLLSGDFGMLFSVDLFHFERTYAISTYAKSHFLISFCVERFSPFDKTGMNTMRIIRILKLYFLGILKLSFNKIFYVTEKLLFSSERAQSADSGAIFGFKIEER